MRCQIWKYTFLGANRLTSAAYKVHAPRNIWQFFGQKQRYNRHFWKTPRHFNTSYHQLINRYFRWIYSAHVYVLWIAILYEIAEYFLIMTIVGVTQFRWVLPTSPMARIIFIINHIQAKYAWLICKWILRSIYFELVAQIALGILFWLFIKAMLSSLLIHQGIFDQIVNSFFTMYVLITGNLDNRYSDFNG